MSDSSEEEDLSRFREAVDISFTKFIDKSTGIQKEVNGFAEKKKSERYLEEASHYNDVKVPEILQKQIGKKISKIISKQIEFVDVEPKKTKKKKNRGGVKLFKDSSEFLSCEEAVDTYTESHNKESKRLKLCRQQLGDGHDIEKIKSVTVDGEYILSKEETKCWKSRRKEKLFKYKSNGKSKVLVAIE